MVDDGVVRRKRRRWRRRRGMHPTGQQKPEKMHEHLVGVGAHLKRKQNV